DPVVRAHPVRRDTHRGDGPERLGSPGRVMGRLRVARLDEVGRLNRLIAASARVLSRGYYSPPQIEALIAQVFGVDTQLLADQTYYVIEKDEELLACGGWSHRRTLFG